MGARLGRLGGSGQSGCGDAQANLVLCGTQGVPERGRGLRLVVGHERAQQPVAHLGAEDREAQAVRSQGVPAAVRDADDQLVADRRARSS